MTDSPAARLAPAPPGLARLAGLLAHEFNNPLAALTMQLHLLAEDVQGQERLSAGIRLATEQAQRMSALIAALQGFVRAHGGGEMADPGPTLPEAVVAQVQERSRACGYAVAVTLAPALPAVRGGADELTWILGAVVAALAPRLPPGVAPAMAMSPAENGIEVLVGPAGRLPEGAGERPTVRGGGADAGVFALVLARVRCEERGGALTLHPGSVVRLRLRAA